MVGSVRNLDIALFFGVMCVVQTLAQFCYNYNDPGCICITISIRCVNLQAIPPFKANGNQFVYLYFQNGHITGISNNSLPPGLGDIELTGHPLTNISDDAFDSSAATLQRLTISGAKFTRLPTALNKLTKLIFLSLQDIPIHDWDSATLKQTAATLKYLLLRNVSLSSWPSWMSDFHLLNTVDFSWNSLKFIPGDAFNSVKDSLEYLSLPGTGLNHIPQALSTLSSLIRLDLSYNNLTDVSEMDTITGSPFSEKISDLNLYSVGLTRMANFSSLTSLTTISLSRNRISDVPAGSLPASLEWLYLSYNNLSSVPEDVASLSCLVHLDLSVNQITGIEPNIFPSSLAFLDLSFNNLTVITNLTFTNLNLLSTLYLDYNPILMISPSAFSNLVSLMDLTIRDSHLTEIPLAFTLLNSRTRVYWTTTESLSCPCPAPQELVLWFASLQSDELFVFCNTGQDIDSYLSGQCGESTTAP